MRDGMQVTWRGRIGPATLSKPEAMGSSEVSAQEEYETSPGRKVPRPSEQVRQAALRGLGLKAQAKDRGLRDKVVRGGGVKKQRQIDPKYKALSTRAVPRWGDTNVSLVGDSIDAFSKSGAVSAKGGAMGWLKGLFQPAAVKAPVAPKVRPKGDAWKPFMSKLKAKAPATPAVPRAPKPGQPMTEGKMRGILKQTQAVQSGDTVRMAQQQGMKVGPWAKIVSNPYGSMLMQMAAMSAIEPLMYGMGIRSPILGGILPFMAMQSLPGLLESTAGIPRMQRHLQFLAERGKMALPSGGRAATAPVTRAASPGAARFMAGAKVASVAIPEITTVFG